MKAYVNMSDQAVEERNERALEDLIQNIKWGDKPRPFDLVDFLAEQDDLPELVFRARQERSWSTFDGWIESRLRLKLRNSQWVEDRASEMAMEDQ